MERKCITTNCNRHIKCHGLCAKHYKRYLDNRIESRAERINRFISECLNSNTISCIVPEFQPNAEYPVKKIGDTYIKIGLVILSRCKGDRPNKYLVMRHLCGRSRCCNPKHLEWGTQKENAEDRKRHGTEPNRRGENNVRAKLTEKDVIWIRANHIRGKGPYHRSNTEDLANKYGVTKATILNIIRGATWA